jgi:hypothetical protein
MRLSLAFLLGLGCASPVLAQPLPFAGRWLLDAPADAQPATQAAYTVLSIKDDRLRWSGPDKSVPACEQEFELKKEKPGTVYLDGRGTKFLAGFPGSIPTYLLTLRSSGCGRAGEDLRIRYPLIYDTQHIDVIEYVGGKPVSSRRFRRKK